MGFEQSITEAVFGLEYGRARYKHNHYFSRTECLSYKHMTKKTTAVILVINRQLKGFQKISYSYNIGYPCCSGGASAEIRSYRYGVYS